MYSIQVEGIKLVKDTAWGIKEQSCARKLLLGQLGKCCLELGTLLSHCDPPIIPKAMAISGDGREPINYFVHSIFQYSNQNELYQFA